MFPSSNCSRIDAISTLSLFSWGSFVDVAKVKRDLESAVRDIVDCIPSSSNRLMKYRAVSSDDTAARVSAAEELVATRLIFLDCHAMG